MIISTNQLIISMICAGQIFFRAISEKSLRCMHVTRHDSSGKYVSHTHDVVTTHRMRGDRRISQTPNRNVPITKCQCELYREVSSWLIVVFTVSTETFCVPIWIFDTGNIWPCPSLTDTCDFTTFQVIKIAKPSLHVQPHGRGCSMLTVIETEPHIATHAIRLAHPARGVPSVQSSMHTSVL